MSPEQNEIFQFFLNSDNAGGISGNTNYITDEEENPITDESGNNLVWVN